jgi:hypothetical protein
MPWRKLPLPPSMARQLSGTLLESRNLLASLCGLALGMADCAYPEIEPRAGTEGATYIKARDSTNRGARLRQNSWREQPTRGYLPIHFS